MKKNIFFKNNKKIYYYLLLILLILFIFIYYLKIQSNYKFFTITHFSNNYYIIPDNIEGKLIPDFGIKILEKNKSEKNAVYINTNELINFKYSIQLYSSQSLENVLNKKDLSKNLSKLKDADIYIGKIESNLGNHFLLLYKTYNNREKAINECNKLYSNKLSSKLSVKYLKHKSPPTLHPDIFLTFLRLCFSIRFKKNKIPSTYEPLKAPPSTTISRL